MQFIAVFTESTVLMPNNTLDPVEAGALAYVKWVMLPCAVLLIAVFVGIVV